MAELTGGGETGGLMGGVVGGRVLFLMTGVAQRAIQRIVVVDVAVGAGAWWHQMRAGQLKTGAGVVEGTIRPLHGVMASLARRGEGYGNVVNRRDGILVIRLMARVARGAGQIVVVVGVAFGTLTGRDHVRAGQREAGAVVIKGCVQPGARVVALSAALREV